MAFTHGLIAIDSTGEVLHFCGYWGPVSAEARAGLAEELKTDPEFGLVGKEGWLLIDAPAVILEMYNAMLPEEIADS